MNDKNQELPQPRTIVACLEGLPDPRINRTRRHKLVDILVIGLCSLLTGGEGFTDMKVFGRAKRDWLKTFLELPNGIPSRDTFNRVFSAIDPDAFLDCFVKWVQGICTALAGDVIAIDGKALRRALNEGASIPYIVSAWASHNGLVLGQVKVDDKSNEITAIPQLLRALYIKGCIVTIDAMGCQKDIAAQIADKEADYVLALKANHATAHEEIEEFFTDAVLPCATQPAPTVAPGAMDSFQTMEESKPVATGNPPISIGSKTRSNGNNCAAWAWSNPSGASRERTPSSAAITSLACPWMPGLSARPCANIGASRTPCIGRSTSRSAKTKAAPARKTPPKTSPPCAESHSISSRRTRARKSPKDKNEFSLRSIPAFSRNYWGFRCVGLNGFAVVGKM